MSGMKVTYFRRIEFACKCGCDTNGISDTFVQQLENARHHTGPMIVNSGYRCKNHPESVKRPTSSHIKGIAADIKVRNSRERYTHLNGLIRAGFTRIGIGKDFIHVDADKDKAPMVAWMY